MGSEREGEREREREGGREREREREEKELQKTTLSGLSVNTDAFNGRAAAGVTWMMHSLKQIVVSNAQMFVDA